MLTWPILYPVPDARDAFDEDVISAAEKMAVDLLWNWTGRIYGTVATTIRPCRAPYDDALGRFVSGRVEPWGAVRVGGGMHVLMCGECSRSACGCSGAALWLPGPVDSITEVTINGEVMDAARYRLDNHSILVRQDGGQWPQTQDLDAPMTDDGTWAVEYLYGREVPEGGKIAAAMLALEIARGLTDDPGCRLPQRMQTITRQGVTMAMLDGFDDLDKGRTGIWLVDSWVASIIQPPRGGTVTSVDVAKRRHVSNR